MSDIHDDPSGVPAEPSMEELDAFMEKVDEFIHLANHLSRETSPSKLAAAMMFAAARYSAYMWQHYGQQLHTRDETVRYLVGQFEAMLEDNIDAPLDGEEHEHKHSPDCGCDD